MTKGERNKWQNERELDGKGRGERMEKKEGNEW